LKSIVIQTTNSGLFNGTLAVYFLLTITFGWKNYQVKDKAELWLHAVPLAIGWGTAVPGLPLRLYNPIGWSCWIATTPAGRGAGSDPRKLLAYRWAFFFSEIWLVFIVTAGCLVAIFLTIWKRERKASKYSVRESFSSLGSGGGSGMLNQRLSKRFATQATLFIAAYFLAFIFPLVMFSLEQATGVMPPELLMCHVVFTPLQGFFDALIYIR